jgi:hypothetical protein
VHRKSKQDVINVYREYCLSDEVMKLPEQGEQNRAHLYHSPSIKLSKTGLG